MGPPVVPGSGQAVKPPVQEPREAVWPAGDSGLLLQLDAFRGLSALLVLASHLAQLFWLPFVAADSVLVPLLATLARHAVLLFFLLSGFFIALSIRRNTLANGRFDALEFGLARVARLYPPLVGALLLTAACVAAQELPGGQPVAAGAPAWTLKADAIEYGGALLFAGGLEGANPVLWSLNFEARLYLLAAMVAWAATRGRWMHLLSLAAVALGVYTVLQTPAFAVFAAVWVLGAGVALAPPSWVRARRRLSVAALLVFVLLALGSPARLSVTEPQPMWLAANHLLAAGAYCALLFDWRFAARVLRWPARTAPLSYTLYLVHWPLLVLLLKMMQPEVQQRPVLAAVGTAIGAALALVVAWALARWLEQPTWFAARLREAMGRTARGLETRT